jgi:hypothetical protein
MQIGKTGMTNPLSKASNGDLFGILWETEDFAPSEFQQGEKTRVLKRNKVRLEPFTNGLPMPV